MAQDQMQFRDSVRETFEDRIQKFWNSHPQSYQRQSEAQKEILAPGPSILSFR